MSEGKCYICNQKYTKRGMTRHIKVCSRKNIQDESGNKKYYHIIVEGGRLYWLHLQMNAEVPLLHLDQFLREIWLECCGHLSSFKIEGNYFTARPSKEFDEQDMYSTADDLFYKGLEFSYTYDYGSSTNLNLKVVNEYKAAPSERTIEILARNNDPELLCSECEEIASKVCVNCVWSGDGWLCEDCAAEHECGEEMLLPVVNSPRVGVCAYSG